MMCAYVVKQEWMLNEFWVEYITEYNTSALRRFGYKGMDENHNEKQIYKGRGNEQRRWERL